MTDDYIAVWPGFFGCLDAFMEGSKKLKYLKSESSNLKVKREKLMRVKLKCLLLILKSSFNLTYLKKKNNIILSWIVLSFTV